MKRAFTLIELLVVIGIIVLIVAILLPTVAGVRKGSMNTATEHRIGVLRAAIDRYYGDFQTYPGLFSNRQVSGAEPGAIVLGGARITAPENLVASLLGGVYPSAGAPAYDPARVGRGAVSFNAANPQAYRAYAEPAAVGLPSRDAAGGWAEWWRPPQIAPTPAAPYTLDTVIPEPMDAFADPLPILYLRARVGATGVASATDDAGQYNYRHLESYGFTDPDPAVFAGADPAARFVTYLTNPSTPGVARSKDAYLLIAAGKDRRFGTADDQTNVGPVQ